MQQTQTNQWGRRRFLLGVGLSLAGLHLPRARAENFNATTGLQILSRDVWSVEPARGGRLTRASKFDRITVHHSARLNRGDDSQNAMVYELQTIQAGHLNRRYGDIGYHFIVDMAGRIWEGRALLYQGAHVLSENACNIGVMLLGDFERERPSRAQLRSAQSLVRFVREGLSIGADRVYGHRDLGASACPGRYLYRQMSAVRAPREVLPVQFAGESRLDEVRTAHKETS